MKKYLYFYLTLVATTSFFTIKSCENATTTPRILVSAIFNEHKENGPTEETEKVLLLTRHYLEREEYAERNKLVESILNLNEANNQLNIKNAQLAKKNNELQDTLNIVCSNQPTAAIILQLTKNNRQLQEEIDSCYDAQHEFNKKNPQQIISITAPKKSNIEEQRRLDLLELKLRLETEHQQSVSSENAELRKQLRSLEVKQRLAEDIATCCSITFMGIVAYNWLPSQTHEKTT